MVTAAMVPAGRAGGPSHLLQTVAGYSAERAAGRDGFFFFKAPENSYRVLISKALLKIENWSVFVSIDGLSPSFRAKNRKGISLKSGYMYMYN